MAHTIITEVCEGVADCVGACLVGGICLQVCPVEGAILAEEKPQLQQTPD